MPLCGARLSLAMRHDRVGVEQACYVNAGQRALPKIGIAGTRMTVACARTHRTAIASIATLSLLRPFGAPFRGKANHH